jgi:hypothetical protein
MELKLALDRCDKYRNGIFSGEELTPEMEALGKRYTSDTGRTFAPYTAAPITIVWIALTFVFFHTGLWLRNLIAKEKENV